MYGRQVQFIIGSNNLEKKKKKLPKSYHSQRSSTGRGAMSSALQRCVNTYTVQYSTCVSSTTLHRWSCSHAMCSWYTLITKNTSRGEDKTLLIRTIKIIQTNLQAINLKLATKKTELIWFGNSPRVSLKTNI